MIYGLALCAGIGALELGLKLALGEEYRAVAYVERDPFAAATLVARMEDQALDRAPVWDDLTTFRGSEWRGIVDIVSAGFPCQPWSVAGKGRGTEDDRWLWPDIARVISDVEPPFVFLENVPPLLTRGGIEPVLRDLASLGFDAEWEVLAASSLEAPHQRKRLYILAYAPGSGLQGTFNTRFGSLKCDSLADSCEGSGLASVGVENFSPFPPGRQYDDWLLVEDELQPVIRGVVDGVPDWVDRIRTIGNGVVPLVAGAAFLCLARRSGRIR